MYYVRAAFTLVEMLVVIGLILLLAAFIVPFLNIGQDTADRNETKVLLATLGVAIDRFVGETGAVPLPTGSAADPNSGTWYPDTRTGSWDKQQLVWRLTHNMTQAEKIAMTDAAEAASLAVDPYQNKKYFETKYNLKNKSEMNAALSVLGDAFSRLPSNSYFDTYYYKLTTYWHKISFLKPTNIDFIDFKDRLLFTGRGFYKLHYMAIQGVIARDLTRRRYLTHPCLDLGEISEDFVQDQTIVDSWGNPLIYVAHSTPVYGEQRYYNSAGGSYERPISLPLGGRIPITDRNRDGSINRKDWLIAPPFEDLSDENRDQKLDSADLIDHNKDGTVDRDDWGSILWNSIPGRASSFFLASAGPDGEFNCLPPEPENDDNILLVEDYND